MKISVRDASNYYRGLLLLIRMDQKVTSSEITLMKRIGQILGFDKEFCEDAIHEIIENRYISNTPPEFSSRELAHKFIKDGLTIAFSDDEIHSSEEQWLKAIAERYEIDFALNRREHPHTANKGEIPPNLEVDDLSINWQQR